MADTATALSQTWTDILPPVAPESVSGWLWISSGVLALLAILVVFVLWQMRPRQRALWVLRRCRKQMRVARVDTRLIAYALHRAIVQGLGLPVARACVAPPAAVAARWQGFYRELQRCVFQATPPTTAELTALIWQARYWLRHYPVANARLAKRAVIPVDAGIQLLEQSGFRHPPE
jgi:hypothetical protein